MRPFPASGSYVPRGLRKGTPLVVLTAIQSIGIDVICKGNGGIAGTCNTEGRPFGRYALSSLAA
jgi:hypothetical protein